MGKAAFIAATRHARQHVVMASTDRIIFAEPVRVGDLIECVASIARVGRSSMTVAVDLIHEDALSGHAARPCAARLKWSPSTPTDARHRFPFPDISNDVQEEAVT